MSTLNVKVPDEMDDHIDAYLDEHPHYLNRSELVRDALRHMIVEDDQRRTMFEMAREKRERDDFVPLREAFPPDE